MDLVGMMKGGNQGAQGNLEEVEVKIGNVNFTVKYNSTSGKNEATLQTNNGTTTLQDIVIVDNGNNTYDVKYDFNNQISAGQFDGNGNAYTSFI